MEVEAGEQEKSGSNYEECLALTTNPNEDLGKVLKAGCKPSLAQMSALMDNPVGNVAMLFNQFDTPGISHINRIFDKFHVQI